MQAPRGGKAWPEARGQNPAEARREQGGGAPGTGDTEELCGGVLPTGGMCYLSEWPKSFLKAVIRHYSRYQVKKKKNRIGSLHIGKPILLLHG